MVAAFKAVWAATGKTSPSESKQNTPMTGCSKVLFLKSLTSAVVRKNSHPSWRKADSNISTRFLMRFRERPHSEIVVCQEPSMVVVFQPLMIKMNLVEVESHSYFS
jgi:hypothetical protein